MCVELLRHKENKRTEIAIVPLGHFSGGKSGIGNEIGPAEVHVTTVPGPDPVALAFMSDLYGFSLAHRLLCIHALARARARTHTHTHSHSHTHTLTHTHVRTHAHTFVYMRAHARTHSRTHE